MKSAQIGFGCSENTMPGGSSIVLKDLHHDDLLFDAKFQLSKKLF